ncbi:MAG: DUF4174 domain-containing protein [Tunicatimonas sp.]
MPDLSEYRWKNRLILLFSPRPDNPLYQQQYNLFRADQPSLDERDLLIFRVLPDRVVSETDTAGTERAARLRERYRVDENAFVFILIGKDGSEKMRSDAVVSRDELYALIDAMPMRREEMRKN